MVASRFPTLLGRQLTKWGWGIRGQFIEKLRGQFIGKKERWGEAGYPQSWDLVNSLGLKVLIYFILSKPGEKAVSCAEDG